MFVGDNVYVYFPQRKAGCTPKLTSFWRGPFEIKRKVSEVLYEVDCGRDGKLAVIHCDRLRKRKSRILTMEDDSRDNQEVSLEDCIEPQTEEIVENLKEPCRQRREVRRPVRFDDYICD